MSGMMHSCPKALPPSCMHHAPTAKAPLVFELILDRVGWRCSGAGLATTVAPIARHRDKRGGREGNAPGDHDAARQAPAQPTFHVFSVRWHAHKMVTARNSDCGGSHKSMGYSCSHAIK